MSKTVYRKVVFNTKDLFVNDIIVVDIDNTIVTNKSFIYGILNNTVGEKRFLSAVRTASQKYKAKIFDFEKVYKKSILNTVFGFLNPKKYYEIPGAVKNINKLSKDYYIFLVTSRPMSKSLNYLLSKNIKNLGINVDYIIADCANKGKCCQMLNAKFMIDNSLNYCIGASNGNQTKAICFNDKKIGEYKSILHLGDWDRIYDFIKYIDPLMERKNQPEFAKWGLINEFNKNVNDKILSFKNIDFLKSKSLQNTK